MALYATCMPLPSDTFHDDKLFACNQGDDADYDHDHEEGLWLSMQPLCLCRRTCFMIISSLHVTKVMMLIMIMTTRPETRDPRSEIRDQRPETRDRRPETRDPRLETRD